MTCGKGWHGYRPGTGVGDDDGMTAGARTGRMRALGALGVALYLAGVAVLAVAAAGPTTSTGEPELYPALVALPPSVVLGVLVTRRRPDSPAGPALVWLATAPCLTWTVESWGATHGTTQPWPGAHLASVVGAGVWVFNLAGFVALCLVFPDGPLPGRRRRLVPWLCLAVAVAVNVLISAQDVVHGGRDAGDVPVTPGLEWLVLDAVAGVAFLAALGAAVATLVARYRRGDDLTRLQLRWLILGAGSVPVLLAGGWVADASGAPTGVAYSGFLLAMLVVLPATVAVAILRHDLLDVDRLLSETLAWVVTSVTAAAVFAGVALGVTGVAATASRPGIATGLAAFAAALVLLPLHRRVHTAVGRVVDHERTVVTAALRDFVRAVRDGEREAEEVQDVLRAALGDPRLAVLLRLPGATGYVDLAGRAADVDPEARRTIPLTARGSDVGAITLGSVTARRSRRARDAAVEVRLPIEVSRLRVELRRALDDARTSRGRLVTAVTEERRRLERDLHDGAQQRIVAVGMRLRSIQARHPAGDPTYEELDVAVAGLEAVIAELRRLAHGVRPSRLDDGLDVAVRDLVSASPIPVTVRVDDVEVSEAVATTAYYVVAESLANTLKHAGATAAAVTISQARDRLTVQVTDDGRGGAGQGTGESSGDSGRGSGLAALHDRVTALGGRLAVESPAGAGTTVRAEL
jgi:signal transduction histidine kinase